MNKIILSIIMMGSYNLSLIGMERAKEVHAGEEPDLIAQYLNRLLTAHKQEVESFQKHIREAEAVAEQRLTQINELQTLVNTLSTQAQDAENIAAQLTNERDTANHDLLVCTAELDDIKLRFEESEKEWEHDSEEREKYWDHYCDELYKNYCNDLNGRN